MRKTMIWRKENDVDYGLKEMSWNGNSEVDNVTRKEVRLSDDVMMWCKQKWWTWSDIYGVKWKMNGIKTISEKKLVQILFYNQYYILGIHIC